MHAQRLYCLLTTITIYDCKTTYSYLYVFYLFQTIRTSPCGVCAYLGVKMHISPDIKSSYAVELTVNVLLLEKADVHVDIIFGKNNFVRIMTMYLKT